VQICVNSAITGQRFTTQNTPETVCRPSSTRTRWGAHSAPQTYSWIGKGPQRGVQENGKAKGDGGKEEGISGKQGEGTERKGGNEWKEKEGHRRGLKDIPVQFMPPVGNLGSTPEHTSAPVVPCVLNISYVWGKYAYFNVLYNANL